MESKTVKNIIINGQNGHSIYRCEYRSATRLPYNLYKGDNDIFYVISEKEECFNLDGRTQVYLSDPNTLLCTRRVYLRRPLQELECDSKSIRIYRPLNAIDDEIAVVVYARLSGCLIQLFGGLYSQCETNAYEVIRSNQQTYSEYIEIDVPATLVNNLEYDAINVVMIPVSKIVDDIFTPSESNHQAQIVFNNDFHFNFGADFGFDENGVPGLVLSANMTKEQFENRYKYSWNDTREENYNDFFQCEVQLSSSPSFMEEETETICTTATKLLKEDEWLDGLILPLELPYDWDNVPRTLLARVKIKYTLTDTLGTNDLYFHTNPIAIDNDRLKYIFNEHPMRISKKFIEDNTMTINIINEIQNPSIAIQQSSQSPGIVYKPLFFKVQEADAINLVDGVVQRVGLDLQDYETKVSSFKLRIGDTNFVETERTGMYVIFKIDANKVPKNVGRFHILDQDAQYITSGKITIS